MNQSQAPIATATRTLKTLSVATRLLLWLVLAAWALLAISWASLHLWIVPRIDDWRPELERWATRAVGVPVKVGAIRAESGQGGHRWLPDFLPGLAPSFELTDVQLMDAQGRELSAADLRAIFDQTYGTPGAALRGVDCQETGAQGHTRVHGEACIAGRWTPLAGQGQGPLDAWVQALATATGQPVEVLDYHEHALGSGGQATAVAYLELRVGSRTVYGAGMDHNLLHASMKAAISGLQRVLHPEFGQTQTDAVRATAATEETPA